MQGPWAQRGAGQVTKLVGGALHAFARPGGDGQAWVAVENAGYRGQRDARDFRDLLERSHGINPPGTRLNGKRRALFYF